MIALLVLLACNEAGPPGECVDDGDCDGIAVCDGDNTCRTVECTSSSQCALGAHCDPDANACFTGCADDGDCVAGQVCNRTTAQCEAGACEDADVDCWYGELCGRPPEAGLRTPAVAPVERPENECYLDPVHCRLCSEIGYWGCVDQGGLCYGGECLLPCDPESEVPGPRGFECLDLWGDFHWYGDCADVDFDRQ